MSLPSIPGSVVVLAAGVALVFTAATIYWAYAERSARGVKRRAQGGGKRVAAGIGLGLASTLGALAGFGEGIFASVGALGPLIGNHAGFAVDLGLAGLGAGVVAGVWQPENVYTFLAASGLIVVVGVLWRGK